MTAPCREDLGRARAGDPSCPRCGRDDVRRRPSGRLYRHYVAPGTRRARPCRGSGEHAMVTIRPDRAIL